MKTSSTEEEVELPADEEESAPKRILVVEDYEPSREALADALCEAGFDVEVAVSGREAIGKALEERPDLILMDLSLPGLDGTEATLLLKADQRTQDIPVIAVSGHRRKEEAALKAGCADFISKPFLTEDVEARIRRLLSGKGEG
jgi:CheY-like chemotaxis protein